jgi:hypothetical protein
MAAQAIRILLRDRGGRFGAEHDQARRRAAAGGYMRAARSMAGLALQSAMAKRTARIIWTRVLGAEDSRHAGIVVAPETGIGTLRTVGARCGYWHGGDVVAGIGRERRDNRTRE